MNTTVKKTAVKTTNNSNLFDYIAALIVAIGIALYYTLKINIAFKWTIVVTSVIAAIGIFFFISPTGINLHGYIKDTWRELGKIVWPTRKEAVQFTWIVFLFVVVLALFLWIVDSSLSWLFYSVILGKA